MSLTLNRKNTNFIHQLHSHLPTGIKIYNQAVMKRSAPLTAFTNIENLNDKELTILFQLQGELQGQVVCTVDLTDRNLQNSHIQVFQSLFTESMNILLGQFLTELERDRDLMSAISHPELIHKEKKNKLLQVLNSKYALNLATKYELFTIKDSYNCSIYILANKNATKEV